MKRKIYAALLGLSLAGTANAQRFVTEVFPSATKTSGVTYGSNISVFPPPTPAPTNLVMDIYEPAGMTDTMARRPLVIFLHTGSFLPTYINQSPTGGRNDSATIEICTQFAKRGYVVANVDYRMGWNPASSSPDVRRGTLLQAIYRSIQDAKAAVRYMYKDAATANMYKIDTNRVIIGGQGTGGYIAMNYAVLNNPAQIQISKFLSNGNEPAYGFVAGQPYVDQNVIGDFDGYGGIPQLNDSTGNSSGYGSKVHFVFNMGGALGDSTWLTAGAPPMVAFHVVGDPFAPYDQGIVYVPGIVPQTVVDVIGSKKIIELSNQYGNNACFANNTFTDAYTMQADQMNGGQEGLYPFNMNPAVQAGPWEWYDSLSTVAGATMFGQDGTLIYNNAKLTNPDMSKAKALAYIDTIMGYLNPRVAMCLNLIPAGINDATARDNSVEIFPNPAADFITVRTSLSGNRINQVELCDVTGRVVSDNRNIATQQVTIQRNGLVPGLYFVTVHTTKGKLTQKLMLQ